jgi:hypothetical protein
VIGGLFVLGSCTVGLLSVQAQVKQPGPVQPRPGDTVALWLGIAMGVGFFLGGRRLGSGRAADTVVLSAFSALIGLFYTGVGVLGMVLAADERSVLFGAGVIGATVGVVLLLPTGLALGGRSEYLVWRATLRGGRHRTDPAAVPRPWNQSRRGPTRAQNRPWGRGRGGQNTG